MALPSFASTSTKEQADVPNFKFSEVMPAEPLEVAAPLAAVNAFGFASKESAEARFSRKSHFSFSNRDGSVSGDNASPLIGFFKPQTSASEVSSLAPDFRRTTNRENTLLTAASNKRRISDPKLAEQDLKKVVKPGKPTNFRTPRKGVSGFRAKLPSASLEKTSVSGCTKIKLSNVPDKFNTADFLRNKFSFYKNLVRVVANPRLKSAVLQFDNHESAKLAKSKGSILFPGTKPVTITWVVSPSTGRTKPQTTAALEDSLKQNPFTVSSGVKVIPKAASTSSLSKFGNFPMKSDVTERPAFAQTKPMVSDMASRFGRSRLPAKKDAESVLSHTELQPLPQGQISAGSTSSHQEFGKAPSSEVPSFFTNAATKQVFGQPILTKSVQLASRPARRSIDISEIKRQLMTLIGTEARTSEQKYKVLEERDKLLRQARRHKHGLQAPSCPDMCPEKERYQREYQMQVGSFEGEFGRIDHLKAVKDYARSSADQEQPLGHELRPGHVLIRTMQYLLNKIVKQCPPSSDAELGLWYDFMWSRTRAIRKDLTQQKLCNKEAVRLFEISTRFHIFAAYWLCELDMQEFDQKINTENMSKCLQSLRHLYEDLAKRGIACESEPEFRSYEVLTSLDDPYVFRQALSWSNTVRNSKEVRSALKLLTAMQTNNFIQFFRTIKKDCSYLQCCLAHRYFTKVRSNAVQTMIRAYSANSQFAVSNLVTALSFHTSSECIEFCQAFGLGTSPTDDNYIIFNRTAPPTPAESLSMIKRASSVLESKGVVPLNEILNGGPLEYDFDYQPVNSFDSSDRYTQDPVITLLLERQDESLDSPGIKKTFAPQEDSQAKEMERIVSEYALSGIIADAVSEEVKKTAVDTLTPLISQRLLHQFLTYFVREHSMKVCSEAESAAKRSRELSDCVAEKTVQEVTFEECTKICREELRKRLQEHLSQLEQRVLHDIWAETFQEAIKSACHSAYVRDVCDVLERLEQVRIRLERTRWRKYAAHWRKKAERARKEREILASFPLRPVDLTDAEAALRLRGKDRLKRGQRQMSGDVTEDILLLDRLKKHRLTLDEMKKSLNEPIDLCRLFNCSLNNPSTSAMCERVRHGRQFCFENAVTNYVQLLLLLDDSKCGAEDSYQDWVLAKFGLSDQDTAVASLVLDYHERIVVSVRAFRINRTLKDTDEVMDYVRLADVCLLVSNEVNKGFADVITDCILKSNEAVTLLLLSFGSSHLGALADELNDLGCVRTCYEVKLASKGFLTCQDGDTLEDCLEEVFANLPTQSYTIVSLATFVSEGFLALIVNPLAPSSRQKLKKSGLLKELERVCKSVEKFLKTELISPLDLLDHTSLDLVARGHGMKFMVDVAGDRGLFLKAWFQILMECKKSEECLEAKSVALLLEKMSSAIFAIPQDLYLCFDTLDIESFTGVIVENCLPDQRISNSVTVNIQPSLMEKSGPPSPYPKIENRVQDEWLLLDRVKSEIECQKRAEKSAEERWNGLISDLPQGLDISDPVERKWLELLSDSDL